MKKRFRKLLSILCTLAMLVCAFAALADEQGAEVTDPPEVTEGEATIPAEGDEPGTLEAEVEDLDELPVVAEETEEEAETPEQPAEVPAEEEPEEAAGEPELTEGNAEELVSESVTLQEAVEEQAGETPVEAEPAGVEPAADQPETADEPADAPETEEHAAPVEPTAPAEEPAAPAEEPEAAEPVAENDPPAEEVSQPEEEPVAPAENEPESKPGEQQPAETPAETPEGEPQEELIQPEEEQPEEPAEDPEEPEEEPEEEPAEEQEEILLNLNGQTSVSGELTIDTPFTFTASDDYFRTVVFTLTVPEEDSVSVTLNDNPVSLTKIENDDPAAAEVQYTFERTLAQDKVYTITLTTEQEEPVPFTVQISEKIEEEPAEEPEVEPAEEQVTDTTGESEEKTAEEDAETPAESTEEAEKREETDLGLEGSEIADEQKNFVIPDADSVDFTITFDEEEPTIGCVAHFKAELTGYDDIIYKLQWQKSLDRQNWEDEPGADQETMDVLMTEDNCEYYWRLKVIIDIRENT